MKEPIYKDKTMRSITTKTLQTLLLAAVAWAGSAQATLITVNSLASPTTVNFSQFVSSPVTNSNGPVQIGGLVGENIEYTGSPNNGLYAFNGGWGLGSNGSWGSGRNGFLGANNARPGEMIITFNSGDVSGVGGFLNYCPNCDGSDLVITAYDAANVLLETYNITSLADIVTPSGTNAGAFRGIQRASNDIHSLHVFGYVTVMDDLAFTRQAVPAPGSLLVLAVGLLGFVAARRVKAV